MKFLSARTHTIIGLVVGLALLAAPWLFGFANLEANAWAPYVIVGILVAGYALVTHIEDAAESPVTE